MLESSWEIVPTQSDYTTDEREGDRNFGAGVSVSLFFLDVFDDLRNSQAHDSDRANRDILGSCEKLHLKGKPTSNKPKMWKYGRNIRGPRKMSCRARIQGTRSLFGHRTFPEEPKLHRPMI